MDERKSENSESGSKTGREAPGSGTASFFTDVVNGTRDVPKLTNFEPIIASDDIRHCSDVFDLVGTGHFDAHIYCSIPTFFEMQRAVALSLSKCFDYDDQAIILDLGASEGTLCKVITQLSSGHIKTFAIDPNVSMKNRFYDGPQIEGSSFIHAAISAYADAEPFISEGVAVPYYDFSEKSDCVIEIMLFQFLGIERLQYVEKIKSVLNKHGIFICCEKFTSYDNEYYDENEVLKDFYKTKWFSQEEIEKKYKEILSSSLNSMQNNQVHYEDMEAMLKCNFAFVICFWDSGNFKGYACSDTRDRLAKLLKNLPDLNSPFTTRITPFFV